MRVNLLTSDLTSRPRGRGNSRARILKAADELAREIGPGHISLEAVAERAGMSKGGLLYNFPSKAALLKAMVAEHLKDAEKEFAEVREREGPGVEPMLRFLVERISEAERCARKPPIGFLAAIAENPELLDPVRDFHARLVQSLREAAADLPGALVVYLALEGIRSLDLMETNVLSSEEKAQALHRLNRMASDLE